MRSWHPNRSPDASIGTGTARQITRRTRHRSSQAAAPLLEVSQHLVGEVDDIPLARDASQVCDGRTQQEIQVPLSCGIQSAIFQVPEDFHLKALGFCSELLIAQIAEVISSLLVADVGQAF